MIGFLTFVREQIFWLDYIIYKLLCFFNTSEIPVAFGGLTLFIGDKLEKLRRCNKSIYYKTHFRRYCASEKRMMKKLRLIWPDFRQ